MPKLIKFAELPFCKWIVLPGTDLCRILLILVEVLEEVVHEEVDDNEGGNKDVESTSKDKAPAKTIAEGFAMSIFEEQRPDLALRIEHVVHNTQMYVPFQSSREQL